MKKLTVVRHAKSSWKMNDLDDFERPLNARGLQSAPLMADSILTEIGLPEIVLCSTAKRTSETFQLFTEKWGETPKCDFIPSLYLAELHTILKIISDIPQNFSSAMLIGHNPGLTDLINYLGNNRLDNLPTCGVMQLEFGTEWSNITAHSGKQLFWDYPKAH